MLSERPLHALTLVILGLAASFSHHANAHDLDGLLRRNSLPLETRQAIDAVSRVRSVLGPGRPTVEEISANPAKLAALKGLGIQIGSREALEGVFDARALWPNNYRLRICFLDGNDHGRSAVMWVAHEVVGHTNLTVDPVVRTCAPKDRADIRVSFQLGDGHWSFIGTDSKHFTRYGEPTMGLDRLDMLNPVSEEHLGIMRHEFMHAIGAMHEHQHPDSGCEAGIKKESIRQAYGWSQKDIETNFKELVWGGYVLDKLEREIVGSSYDPQSIMHYKLPAEYFTTGDQHKCFLPMKNTRLSAGDISLLRQLYPK